MIRQNPDKRLASETKKEYIIRLAKEDPFLKIEEIAEIAQTTQRYVRTILSEANLSLMNLREEYARRMEKYSEMKILFSIKRNGQSLHTDFSKNKYFMHTKPQFYLIESSEEYDWHTKSSKLIQYVQQVYYNGVPLAIISIITDVNLTDELLQKDVSLFEMFGLKTENTRLTCPEIEIGALSSFLKKDYTTEFKPEESVLKISTIINVKNRVFGEEMFFFPSKSIKLIIPGIFNPTLELSR